MKEQAARDQIGIVGLGLIGASLAAALGPTCTVVGVDLDAATEAFALAHRLVERTGREALADCNAVFVCTPVAAVSQTIREVFRLVGDRAVISDVASVKAAVADGLPRGIRYVGGHPMAGREKGGIRAYSPYLLQNAIYVLTAAPSTRKEDFAYIAGLIGRTGAIPVAADARAHDAAVSKTSHLPHLLAYTLADTALGDELSARLAAGSFRDMTRVAAADPDFWCGVALANRDNLLADMDEFIRRFSGLRDAVAAGDTAEIRARFDAGRKKRAGLDTGVAHVRPLCVDVEDRSGVLGRVTTLLGENGVNIANVRILHSREGVGGALMLEFLTQNDYDAAKRTLSAAGYCAD